MSVDRNLPIRNRSWLHSEPSIRALQRLTVQIRRNADRVIEDANSDVNERVRRVLEYSDSENEPETFGNVITERVFEFNDIDESILPETGNGEIGVRSRRIRLPSNSSVSNASSRGDYSLISYDSNLFEHTNNSNMANQSAYDVPVIQNEDVEREIDRLRHEVSRHSIIDESAHIRPGPSRGIERDANTAILGDIIASLHSLSAQVTELQQARVSTIPNQRQTGNATVNWDITERNIHGVDALVTAENRKRIKEARDLIPIFDGKGEEKLKEFLQACAYAYGLILPAEETALTIAIKYTKLRGQALVEVENRNINTYQELREALETVYSRKKSTTRLQREFNNLRQKPGEGAREFGQRVERLATDLFESSMEGTAYLPMQKQGIHEYIKTQALINFQLGLNEKLQTIVRSRAPLTLADAIAGAVEEEKVKGITGNYYRETEASNLPRASSQFYSRNYDKAPVCQKCGKTGHNGRDCRISRYGNRFSLPKPEGTSRVNTAEKFCTYCKRNGHIRENCWTLNGKPQFNKTDFSGANKNKTRNPQYQTERSRDGRRKFIENEEAESDREEKNGRKKPAHEYRVNQLKPRAKIAPCLDLISLSIKQAKGGKVPLLFDTGSSITFLKLRNIKDEVMISEHQLALTGITGHSVFTIGKFRATITIGKREVKHYIYVVKDDFPIDYEGILGVDFLQAQQAKCDYHKGQIEISGIHLKLQPYKAIILKPRSETIIPATTNSNKIGLVLAEERLPGVFIGNCIVQPKERTCKISILNTTEETMEIGIPHVTVEGIDIAAPVHTTHTSGAGTITSTRAELVKKLLRTQHLNAEERKAIENICETFSDIFFLEGDPLTHTSYARHAITVQTDTAPINMKPYRLPEKHNMEVKQQINEMLQNKIIRPSRSQWNAPLLVVPKKLDASGKPKLRVVVDFRKLNNLTVGDSFPLPNITDILDQLGNAKYFTTLDLASGYHQIPMAERDREKTAFSTPTGHYEFNRMPFGLKNAPATFQRLMNTVLSGLQGIECLVYLDDIVLYGASLEEHNKRLTTVFQRLRESNLKLQPDKCEFLRKEVVYLGHIISEDGIMPDPSKLTAVKNFPIPKKIKDIQSFIGLAGYYRRFIQDFSKIAKPLTKLTKKGEPFIWNQEQQHAFEILKEKLTTAPVLQFPDFTREFIITTDASDFAVGAIISQGEVGRDKPIAYASRILSRAEQNYNTTEKELLAIVWAVKHFRPYVYGTKFKIVTDHKPLIWLFNVTDPGSRLIRWRLKLEEYNYEIVHKSGKANTNADALSRNVGMAIRGTEIKDDDKEEREYTEEERKQILYEYHDAPLGGHQGVERTLRRIRLSHNWPGITMDVRNHISRCEKCQKNKLSLRTKSPLVITDTPDYPFEKCALDIVGPLTVTNNGNKYLLTFQDNLTKFSKAIPIENQEASTIAKEFVTKIVLEYGIPAKVLTDQGTNFLSQVFKNTCRLLKIEKIQTTAYHPQSNGALERSHRTLAEYLRHFLDGEQTDWDEWIPYAMFTYNTTPHTSTGFTPYELIYGHKANLPTAVMGPPKLTYSMEDYATELRERLRATNKIAKENIISEKHKHKQYYDQKSRPNIFRVGDQVLLYDEAVRRGRSKKLDALWIGPYIVLEKHSDVNYTIKKGRKTVKVHADRLKLYVEN